MLVDNQLSLMPWLARMDWKGASSPAFVSSHEEQNLILETESASHDIFRSCRNVHGNRYIQSISSAPITKSLFEA
jgi:hypothetical protein